MPTSPFFNNYNNRQEQWLVEDLIHEAVKMLGFDCYYVPNSNESVRDLLFSDDPLKKFKNAYPLEVYLVNSTDPGMSGDFFSKFGLEVKNSVRIQLPRRAFAKRVPQNTHTRPKEGDLIYIPFLSGKGELYEIKFVNDATDFFTLGRKEPYYWELELELFKYSHEEIDTGVEIIDIVNENDAYSIVYTVSSGNGDYIEKEIVYQGTDQANATAFGTLQDWNLPEMTLRVSNMVGDFANNQMIIGATSNAQYMISSFDSLNEPKIENQWDNKIIKDEIKNILDQSEINPLGML